jgi:hypothetical protein
MNERLSYTSELSPEHFSGELKLLYQRLNTYRTDLSSVKAEDYLTFGALLGQLIVQRETALYKPTNPLDLIAQPLPSKEENSESVIDPSSIAKMKGMFEAASRIQLVSGLCPLYGRANSPEYPFEGISTEINYSKIVGYACVLAKTIIGLKEGGKDIVGYDWYSVSPNCWQEEVRQGQLALIPSYHPMFWSGESEKEDNSFVPLSREETLALTEAKRQVPKQLCEQNWLTYQIKVLPLIKGVLKAYGIEIPFSMKPDIVSAREALLAKFGGVGKKFLPLEILALYKDFRETLQEIEGGQAITGDFLLYLGSALEWGNQDNQDPLKVVLSLETSREEVGTDYWWLHKVDFTSLFPNHQVVIFDVFSQFRPRWGNWDLPPILEKSVLPKTTAKSERKRQRIPCDGALPVTKAKKPVTYWDFEEKPIFVESKLLI